ncbi:cAMP-binding domain of CRP or a regulatory subunit of cAMP-dependent protein kinases [Clostridium cavendishii DSM 21758]|uniref:cAMP-binding domain of CRP or a regulatory subunit of cAMP-dependent protein kinases n=1 Tax=Clostridium cavendishii DSM 21758 TaxID=1121302 RepID=A0A1M6PEQ5_9CLOT|nr:Crp/Fnr family transcriptional regulator [Clostridium cavendishii]SHK06416.1 cAMP-binding domain of CRP or a regulatory subunit of cAMP-dependent protein kinases [Clostridium cavendishii DSM 21758]
MNNLNEIITSIQKCRLFSHFNEDKINSLFKNDKLISKTYNSSDIIFNEDDTCNYLSIIITGIIEIQKLDPEGNVLTVATLSSGNVFGENLLFGDRNQYPMSVVCKTAAKVIHLPKSLIYSLCQTDSEFLTQLLRVLSNKALSLSSKLKQVSMKSLRQMICHFLMIKYKKSNSLVIPLGMSKKEWSEKLGVQRPSLSRELIKMKEEGIIDYNRTEIIILDIEEVKSQS